MMPSIEAVKKYAQAVAGRAMPNYPHDEKALHTYRNIDGNPIYWRMRVKTLAAIPDGEKSKQIRPFHWDGTKFTNNEPPAPPEGKPLYGLELLTPNPGAMLIIVEGENKADAINKASQLAGKLNQIIAITSGGKGSAKASNWAHCAGRNVAIFRDNDQAGLEYQADVIECLAGFAASIRIIDIAAFNLPNKGDAVDYFKAGGTLEGIEQAIAGATAADIAIPAPVQDDGGGWPAPQPLTSKLETEHYPVDALPDTIRAAVEEVCGFVKAPVPMVASCAISAMSLAIQAHYDVERANKLHSPVGTFLLTIADSGERKSTCDGFFTKAIRDYEAAQAEAAKPLLKDYKAAIEAWEAKRAGIKDQLRQLAKAGKPTAMVENELRELQHDMPEPPRVPRLIYTDVTPQQLAYNLAKGWPSGGVVSAEAGLVFGSHGMGKDSAMLNLATLNQLWDGNDLAIDRRTSESFTVRGARLTVALQVQSATLLSFFDKSGALARGTGFLARFLIAWPESTQGHRPFTEAPENWPNLAAFNRCITQILNLPAPIDDDGALIPQTLTLTPEAKAAWIGYHNAIESELASGGELFDVRDAGSKSADNAARLAALFHVFEGGLGAISGDAFERASRIAAWHLNESRRFFGELALPAEMADAARLDGWIIEYCKREHTHCVGRRYAQRHGTIRDGNRLDAAISELVSLDRIQLRKDGKQLSIWLNPALMDGGRGQP